MDLSDVKILNLPRIYDDRGNLSFVENKVQLPFDIARVYWIYDVPGGEVRSGHAYHTNQEVIIALSGSFDVTIDDGKEVRKFCLNRSYYGLYIPAGIWREFSNFSTNSFALEIASQVYDESDYVYDYEVYKKLKTDGKI